MEGEPVLLALAAVSVTLTGFASLLVGLRHGDPKDWPLQWRVRLRTLVEGGLFVAAFAFFPIGLYYLGLGPDILWRAASLVLAFGIAARVMRVHSRSWVRSGSQFGSWLVPVSLMLEIALVIANLANVVWPIGMPTTFGIYLAGLLGMALVTTAFFWRLVTVMTGEADEGAFDQPATER